MSSVIHLATRFQVLLDERILWPGISFPTNVWPTKTVLRRYNTVMKLVFLGTSLSIIYFMRFHPAVRATYDKEQDTFRSVFLLVPCAVLALIINQERTTIEVCTLLYLSLPHFSAPVVKHTTASPNNFQ